MKKRAFLAGLIGLPVAAAAAVATAGAAAGPAIDGYRVEPNLAPLFDMEAWDRCARQALFDPANFDPGNDGVLFVGFDGIGTMSPYSCVSLKTMSDGSILMQADSTVSELSPICRDPELGPFVRSWFFGTSSCVGAHEGLLDVEDYFGAMMKDPVMGVPITGFDNRCSPYDMAGRLVRDGHRAMFVPSIGSILTPVIHDLRRLIEDGRIVHGGDGGVRWMISNAYHAIREDGGILPCKSKPESLNSISVAWALIRANAVRLAHLSGEIP